LIETNRLFEVGKQELNIAAIIESKVSLPRLPVSDPLPSSSPMGQLISFLCTLVRVQLFAKLPDTHADLTGRTYLITGSNTGLGLALAIHLARLNPAQIILAVRDLKKGKTAKESIIAQTGYTGSLEVWELDMASFASVRRFAERANATLKRLDGAVLNAGVNSPKWEATADGWERK
jgi:hypothetical protein